MGIISGSFVARFFSPDREDPGCLRPRWLFLRALGLIFFSAFYSLLFQIQGLIGPEGILPARDYLSYLTEHMGGARFWIAPTFLWLGNGTVALNALCGVGLIAATLLIFNISPRLMTAVCTAAFLSFISAARDFSSYQSDGMLMEAGFVCLFFAPSGWRPGLGEDDPPSRASQFLLQWLWFRIYFESGVAKILGGDPHWRHLTAMDDYYQNGPLPTWIGWYAQQLPHAFHAATTLWTLIVELFVVWMLFLPRPWRIVCFWVLLPFQIGIILTANYTFLNYLVLALSVLLLDDQYFNKSLSQKLLPPRWGKVGMGGSAVNTNPPPQPSPTRGEDVFGMGIEWRLWLSAFFLTWVFYDTASLLVLMVLPVPLPTAPIAALEPFRIAERYGLFAVMTPERHEIEFQGSQDGKTWTPYPFRYKPQSLNEPPRIYAPYQPRFDWNLWFASLENGGNIRG